MSFSLQLQVLDARLGLGELAGNPIRFVWVGAGLEAGEGRGLHRGAASDGAGIYLISQVAIGVGA